jgi:hypothetical protein
MPGALSCSGIPHLSAGLQAGLPLRHAARGRERVVDFLWRAVNVVAGLAFLSRHPVILGTNFD